jgi:sec-independent protein translocase protein TatA
MGGFSLWHILIFAVIVLLLFGGNRFSAMMGDVAKGLKSFKAGMADDDEQQRREAQRAAEPRQIPPQKPYDAPAPIDITPQPAPRADAPVAPQPPRDDSAR